MSEVIRAAFAKAYPNQGALPASAYMHFEAGAQAVIDRVKAIHRPHGVYDECDCQGEHVKTPVVETEFFSTCDPPMYYACAECCLAFDGESTSEDCSDSHDHREGRPLCATLAAIESA